jgi:hypothetical protein
MIKLNTHANPNLYRDNLSDEKRYEWQMSVRANYLILGDKEVNVPVDVISSPLKVLETNLVWLHRGELIAGSFMSNLQTISKMENTDIDIYFKNIVDVNDFLYANPIQRLHVMNETKVAMQVHYDNQILNLIHGVAFDDAKDLITHFDIRACSIAYDPQWNLIHVVRGALHDAAGKCIVFNPVPHNTTVARVVKYAKRGFDMDPYQRLFFSELIKSDMYNPDLELSTGYRAIQK